MHPTVVRWRHTGVTARNLQRADSSPPVVALEHRCSPLGRDANDLLLRDDELLVSRQPYCTHHEQAPNLCYDLAMALLRTGCIDAGAMEWPWN